MKVLLRSTLLILAIAILNGCFDDGKEVLRYETRVYFFADEPVLKISPTIDEFTHAGWEIKSSRRAYEEGALGSRWGYEYVLQKPIYDE